MILNVSRRKFLSSIGLAVALPGAFYIGRKYDHADDLLLGGGKYHNLDTGKIENVISCINLQTSEYQLATTSFLPHGFHRHPMISDRFAVFEKRGLGACEYDLKNKRVSRYIQPRPQHYFYGHGCYSADGKVLMSTETNMSSLEGVISIRDSENLDYLGDFPSYGKEPHECKLIADGKVLVVTNGGGVLNAQAPSVAYIDVESQALIEKLELNDPRLNTGHMGVLGDGGLIVVSAPRTGLSSDNVGGISIRGERGLLDSFTAPKAISQRLVGEALSVAVHEQLGIAAVTHPDGNLVTFWSIANKSFISSIELSKPRGIELSADGKYFWISFGVETGLARISVDELEIELGSSIRQSFISGSHIYNLSRELTEIFAPGPLA
jgi:hypothetical protein